MTTYTQQAIDKLLDKYTQLGGEIYTITGSLVDNYIAILDGYKSAIIKEVYLNAWSSANSITFYNKLPKKYQQVIDLLDNDNTDKAEKLFWS